MTEEGKRHFDLYKFLCFPWGAIIATPFWYGITKAIEAIMGNVTITLESGEKTGIPWWCIWVLFAVGEIAIFVFLVIYSYTLPRGNKHGHNVFILISPEHFADDKYITSDFVENFGRHANGSIEGLNIFVAATLKRETFNRIISKYPKKHENYWESRRWKRLHKRLKGSLYISGTLKRRSSNGKENFVFNLSATIGYNNVNQDITPLMIDELKKNFPQTILINKEFELEEFEAMSDRFATFSEYLIGWAHLVSGNVGLAYKMHLDIFANNKQSFFKRGALKNLSQLLHLEIDSILKDCKLFPLPFVSSCAETAQRLFPDSDSATTMIARFLIMTSSDETFDINLSRAQALLNKARINGNNRATIHANRGYLALLKGNYFRAETEYNTLFKNRNERLIDDVVAYCDSQIKDGCSKERPTAYYVKALMLSQTNNKDLRFSKAIESAIKNIPEGNEYYHIKLNEMSAHSLYEGKRKKKKR